MRSFGISVCAKIVCFDFKVRSAMSTDLYIFTVLTTHSSSSHQIIQMKTFDEEKKKSISSFDSIVEWISRVWPFGRSTPWLHRNSKLCVLSGSPRSVHTALIKIEEKKKRMLQLDCVLKWRRNLPFGAIFIGIWHGQWCVVCMWLDPN